MRTLTCAFSVGLLVLCLSPARAAESQPSVVSDTAIEHARASFKQGVALFTEGSYEAALAEFGKAYRLAPSYRVLYNIARAYDELHDYVNARKTLRQYIRDGGDEISASRRGEVDEMNQRLEARIATLEIATNVAGADIRVDDLSVGLSPLSSAILVNAGPRRISVVKPGYAVAAQTVTVAGAEVAKVALNLSEASPRPQERHAAVARATPVVLKNASSKNGPGTAMAVSLAITATCAVATVTVAWLAMNAKRDFESQLDTFPNTKEQVDSSRTRMRTYAFTTDALGVASLVAGGMSVYFALSGHRDSQQPALARHRSVTVTPTLGGMLLQGTW